MSKLLIAVGASLILAGPAAAQSDVRAVPVPLPAGQSDVNKTVCERQDELGSRLKGKKVCMTVEQWKQFRAENREKTEELQRLASTRPSN
jgi:hypothetical protein